MWFTVLHVVCSVWVAISILEFSASRVQELQMPGKRQRVPTVSAELPGTPGLFVIPVSHRIRAHRDPGDWRAPVVSLKYCARFFKFFFKSWLSEKCLLTFHSPLKASSILREYLSWCLNHFHRQVYNTVTWYLLWLCDASLTSRDLGTSHMLNWY